ncbi:DDE Tnp IS1595 domain-containing protein, partial [Aphis craccivora]
GPSVTDNRFFIVEKRDRATLLPIIQREEVGSTIHSDDWRAYSNLSDHADHHPVFSAGRYLYMTILFKIPPFGSATLVTRDADSSHHYRQQYSHLCKQGVIERSPSETTAADNSNFVILGFSFSIQRK